MTALICQPKKSSNTERCGNIYGGGDIQNLEYGLPPEDAQIVCEEKYAKEVVKLTIQIVDPSIKLIEKDVSATFNDKLGVVGTCIVLKQNPFCRKKCFGLVLQTRIELRILSFTLNRRNNWSFHWTQLD